MAFLVSARISQIASQFSEIFDYLYLSSAQAIRPDRIRQKKITCIVNATVDEPSLYLPGIDYLKIRVDDNPLAHLDAYFDMVADRIKQVRDAGGRVLVHCVAGVSRSASLILAYLVKYEHMSLRQAYYHVKSARPIIRPNLGFWKQLVDYERRIHGKNSIKLLVSKWGDMVPDVYTEELKHALHQVTTGKEATIKGDGGQTNSSPATTIVNGKGASIYTYAVPLNGGGHGHGHTRRLIRPGRTSNGQRRSFTPPASKHSPLLMMSSGVKLKNNSILSSLYNSTDLLLPRL